jgi:membrane fusion protein (multidrug efflux system)
MKLFKIQAIILALIALSLPACQTQGEQPNLEEEHKIVVTSPKAEDVTITQPYVCLIHAKQHIDVRAWQHGYLVDIGIEEGQAVKKGDVLFQIVPTLAEAKYNAEKAEADLAALELKYTKGLAKTNAVSQNEVALYEAKLAKAKAKAKLAEAEWHFTDVTAPFDGIVDRQEEQLGSMINEGDVLTTLSDNSVMWVYFNVPEARYLEYKARQGTSDPQHPQRLTIPGARIQLQLADGSIFNQTAGDTVTVESNFNNETGNIPFRADFKNPDRLLRHGQTGTVLIHQTLKNAILIPQRATFEILDRQYVYVVDEDDVVHQREIVVEPEGEKDDVFVIKSGLGVDDKIVLEGIRQVRDGEKVEYEFSKPEEALANLKLHAE